jgi:hypothetical protein
MVDASARLLPSWQNILCAGRTPSGRYTICTQRGVQA